MGLDVYLYRYEDFDLTTEREEKFSKFVDEIWLENEPYNDLTEEHKNEIRAIIDDYAKKLRLNSSGEDDVNKKRIELPSNLYPEHYFKIGYFRSSYNPSGINRILSNYGFKTLNDIFGNEDNEYLQKPDWSKVLKEVDECIEKFKNKYPCMVEKISARSDRSIENEADAMKLFLSEVERQKESKHDFNYSNRNGEFYLSSPLEVLGIIPGINGSFGRQPVFYVVSKTTNDYYIQALEIVRETINYVLEQKDINKYYLKWSG